MVRKCQCCSCFSSFTLQYKNSSDCFKRTEKKTRVITGDKLLFYRCYYYYGNYGITLIMYKVIPLIPGRGILNK